MFAKRSTSNNRQTKRTRQSRRLRLEALEPRQVLAVAQPSGIIWDASPNFNGRGGTDIESVVIHTTEGSFSGAVSWMKNPTSEVSAHYIISPTGEIRQLVTDANRAWHATYYNSRSIGIEMAGWAADPATWNSTNLARLEHLVAWLVQQYDVPLVQPPGNAYDYPNDQYNAPGIVAHAQLQPWNRSDPGPHFPWSSFITNVGSRLTSAPVANPDTFTTAEDTPLAPSTRATGVVANDSDADGDTLTAILVTPPTHGTLSLNTNGSFTYTPDADFHGTDTFEYRVRDEFTQSSRTTATITVTPVNDAPRAKADRFVLDEDTTLSSARYRNTPDDDGDEQWLSENSTWRFLANGSDQGTAWRERLFDDGSWQTGRGEFGYGEGDENTVVGYGPDANNKYVTTYFRQAFDVHGADQVPFVWLRIKRDDGAAVYLNGVEILRDLLPADAAYNTLAANAADDGQTFAGYLIPTPMLVDGTNTIAVEVHQAVLNSSDLSFAMDLFPKRWHGLLGNDFDPDPPSIDGRNGGLTASLATEPAHGTVEFDADGEFVYTPHRDFVGEDTFTYRATDGTGQSSPAVVTLVVQPRDDAASLGDDAYEVAAGATLSDTTSNLASVELIQTGARWKYLDDGSNQGTQWRTTTFSDAAWRAGGAQLGYGDGDESAIVGFGGDAASKHATTYFRHTFQVGDPARVAELSLRLLVDDGAAVYLNGVEIARTVNLAPGAAFDALADYNGAAAIGGDDENRYLDFAGINPTLLRAGDNVLAVEVHQHARSSTDLSFDAQLTARRRVYGVLRDDTDVDGREITAHLYGNGAAHGDVVLDANGSFTYTPDAGFAGNDQFSYRTRETRAVLVAAGSVWRYYDAGDLPWAGWRETWPGPGPRENDLNWKRGPAPLGYGDGDEATLVAGGANPTRQRITTYFRREFSIGDDDAIESLLVRLARDDGAAVYINGTEVARSGLPADAEYDTLAQNATDDGNAYHEFVVPAGVLHKGSNVIAVEVHQAAATSSDLSFDLELLADVVSGPATVHITVTGTAGDLNGDGVVDRGDLATVVAAYAATGGVGSTEMGADINGDGRVSLLDAIAVRNAMTPIAGGSAAALTRRVTVPADIHAVDRAVLQVSRLQASQRREREMPDLRASLAERAIDAAISSPFAGETLRANREVGRRLSYARS